MIQRTRRTVVPEVEHIPNPFALDALNLLPYVPMRQAPETQPFHFCDVKSYVPTDGVDYCHERRTETSVLSVLWAVYQAPNGPRQSNTYLLAKSK
jgi:hypothetical protein